MNSKLLLTLLIILALLTGCYREDYEECPEGRYIYFQSIMPKYEFAEIVESIDLYVYSHTGELVNTYNYPKQAVTGNKCILPFQPVGEYTLVAVINVDDEHYETTDTDNFSAATLSLRCENQSDVRKLQCDVYHGQKPTSFDRYSIVTYETDTIDVYKNTNNFSVTIKYVGGPLPNGEVNLHMTGNNGAYRFNNRAISHCYRKYHPHNLATITGADPYRMRTMRVVPDTDLMLNIEFQPAPNSRNAGSQEILPIPMLNIDIAKYLASVTDFAGNKLYDTEEKLEREDEFELILTVSTDYKLLSMKINNWSVIESGEDII